MYSTCMLYATSITCVVKLKMAGLGMWLRMAGTMAAVMLVGWGLMKTTSPSAEDMMNVRTDYNHPCMWQPLVIV